MKKSVLVVLVGALVMLASGCNTVKGVGKDIQRGGEKIEKAAS